MKLAFFMNTPAHVHLYRYITRHLERKDHQVKILARDYGCTLDLLDELGFEYSIYADVPESKYGKLTSLPFDILSAYDLLREYDPDLLVGVGVYSAFTSQVLRKPCIVFNDSEPTPVQFMFLKPFTTAIITPARFGLNLGKKHIRIDGYKELAYLHPNHFRPDETIFDLLGIARDEDFVLLRFNAFDAVHDFGVRGFSLEEKRRLVNELKKFARVFISSEGDQLGDLSRHSVKIPKHRIHDVLHYAKMVIADTQTMVTESGLLGTPAIRYNSFVGKNDMSNFIELEREYDLIYSFSDPDEAISRAVELVQVSDLKKKWRNKREKLLKDKIDVSRFMIWFIEEYPESIEVTKTAPEYSRRFK